MCLETCSHFTVDANQSEYACYFHAMITDWRSKWSEGTQGNTRPELPFGFVQVHHSYDM